MLCPKCSTELPEGSAFCNHCGANLNTQPESISLATPTTPGFVSADTKKKKRKTLIIAGAIVLILALLIVPSRIKAASNNPGKPNEGKAINVEIPDVRQAYATNEVRADEVYKGKTLICSGVVDSITTLNQTIRVTLRYDGYSVFASFSNKTKDAEKIAELQSGNHISVCGWFGGSEMRFNGLPIYRSQ